MQHIIIDLEFTTIPKKFCGTVSNEIIEIGAVRLDDGYKYVDSFSTFVRPQFAQNLSFECENLTGIHPVNLHNAPFFQEGLALLETWIGTEPFRIYQWSDNDHTQIVGECALKGVTSPLCSKHWIDLQRLYCRVAGLERVVSLERALSSLNILFEGSVHRASDDALNTASVLQVIKNKEECAKRFNKIRALLKPRSCSCTLGDLLGEKMQILYDELSLE